MQPCPSPCLQSVGDVQQGGFFNRTRLMIKQQTIQTRDHTYQGPAQPDGLQSHHSHTSSNDRGSRGTRTTPKPTVAVEDYLSSLLPTSGFGASIDLALPMAGFAVPPTPQLKPQLSVRQSLGKLVRAKDGELPPPEECPSPALRGVSTLDDDPSVNGGQKKNLLATYHYQQVGHTVGG